LSDPFAEWTTVAAGGNYSLGLRSDGTLWAWGDNTQSQLGDGTTGAANSKNVPTRIGVDDDWAEVAAGWGHTLALKSDGTLWAWGLNTSSQLGDGTTVAKNVPTKVGTDDDWAEVAAGQYHSFALKDDGSLWAWGQNTNGKLGDGTTVAKNVPTKIGADTDWVAVDGGIQHSLAIKSDGTLWAWGLNTSGQLGDGTTVAKNVPTCIGTDDDWETIAAKNLHSLAIKSDGTLWAWGRNVEGQIGDGTVVNKTVPTLGVLDSDWEAIAAGDYYSLGIKSDGSLWAWGQNTLGQLGDGTTSPDGSRSVPARIGSDSDWDVTAAGSSHSLGIKTDGTLWTWGSNAYGQLGDGRTGSDNDRNVPTCISAPGPDTTPPVSVSDAEPRYIGPATVTITAADEPSGSGIGSITYRVNGSAPETVTGGIATLTVSEEGTHTIEFWATDIAGNEEVPHNTAVFTVVPAPPAQQFVRWTAISGGGHRLALKEDGTLWGWGGNAQGQLGDGTTVLKSAPVRIGGGAAWAAVSAQGTYSVALKSDGSLWAWGANTRGQLGDGTFSRKTIPTRIGTGTDWKAVSAGADHSLALKQDGSLWAWGYNNNGQLGDGTTVDRNVPTRIGTDSDWKAVSTGSNHSLALKSDGTLWAWGAQHRPARRRHDRRGQPDGSPHPGRDGHRLGDGLCRWLDLPRHQARRHALGVGVQQLWPAR